MKIFFLVCLIGFAAGDVYPDSAVPEGYFHPGFFGISDAEKVCIENYLNGEVLNLECDGSIKNVMNRVENFFNIDNQFDEITECVRYMIKEYKYKDVYLQFEYNMKTNGKTHELSKMAQAATKAMQIFCHDFMERWVSYAVFNFYSKNVTLEHAQCAYRYSIEKQVIKKTDYDIDPKDFDSVDCKSFYEEWSSTPVLMTDEAELNTYVGGGNFLDNANMTEFEKCVQNRPSLMPLDLERFALASVCRLTNDKYLNSFKGRQDYFLTMFFKERAGMECIRELGSKVIARS